MVYRAVLSVQNDEKYNNENENFKWVDNGKDKVNDDGLGGDDGFCSNGGFGSNGGDNNGGYKNDSGGKVNQRIVAVKTVKSGLMLNNKPKIIIFLNV